MLTSVQLCKMNDSSLPPKEKMQTLTRAAVLSSENCSILTFRLTCCLWNLTAFEMLLKMYIKLSDFSKH